MINRQGKQQTINRIRALGERRNWRARPHPLAGVWAVFRHQMRRRSAMRDLLAMIALLTGLTVVAAGIVASPMLSAQPRNPMAMAVWPQTVGGGPFADPDIILHFLMADVAAMVVVLLPCASVLGAGAAPSRSEFVAVQSALLTRLTPRDLCAGRLLAALWPVLTTIGASCALWLALQLQWRFVPTETPGYDALVEAHGLVLIAAMMTGAIGFLGALKRRPGRNWIRGTFLALLPPAFGVTAVFAVKPFLARLAFPALWIKSALVVNPITAATAALHLDIARQGKLFSFLNAPDYASGYPSPLLTTLIFGSVAMLAWLFAAAQMRRAYR